MKSIWKCRPHCGRHFDVGFINQALLAKVSPLDKAPFCGGKKPPLLVGIPTNQIGTWFKLPELSFKIKSSFSRASSHARGILQVTLQNHRAAEVVVFVRVPFLKLGNFNFDDPSPSVVVVPSDNLDTLETSWLFVRSFGVRDFAPSLAASPSF